MNITSYSLKAGFQQRLLSAQNLAVKYDISPNLITLISCGLCIVFAGLLYSNSAPTLFLILLSPFLLLRMALNALDGMVATATDSQSPVGSVLNEVCDVISDVVLFAAITALLPVPNNLWWGLIALAVLIEFLALAVYQAIGTRPFLGPFGKSDRAIYLGLLAVLLLLFPESKTLFFAYVSAGVLLALITLWNRFKVV